MKNLAVVFALLATLQSAFASDAVHEASATGNLRALAGKWQPVESCHHLLHPDDLEQNPGLEISVDKQLGDSHRKTSLPKDYIEKFSAYVEGIGHKPLASGCFKLYDGAEEEYVVTRKNGSLYLWYGYVFGGNPRIFLGRGAKEPTADTLVVEWLGWLGNPDDDSDRDYTTIVYRRVP